jgi:hypothetical protein
MIVDGGRSKRYLGGTRAMASWLGCWLLEAPSFSSPHLTPAGGLVHDAQGFWHPALKQ